MSKIRKVDGLMISQSDVRWNAKSNVKILNKLKYSNQSVVVNDSNSGEEVEEVNYFLKGGTLTASRSRIVNYADVCCTHEQENGWWNAVMIKGNRKMTVLKNAHGIVDSEPSRTNSFKTQHERAIRSVKIASKIKSMQLKESVEHAKSVEQQMWQQQQLLTKAHALQTCKIL